MVWSPYSHPKTVQQYITLGWLTGTGWQVVGLVIDFRTCWINAGSSLWHWHQCRSRNINVDQWTLIPINTSQYGSMPINAGLEVAWSALIGIDQHIDPYWSVLIFIEPHFGSITEFWSGIDRYWSALIIDRASPVSWWQGLDWVRGRVCCVVSIQPNSALH